MIVLDCSAAMQIVKGTEKGKAIEGLFLPNEEVIAPTYFAVEAANAAWKYVHAGKMSYEDAEKLLDDVLELPDRYVAVEDLIPEAFAEGIAADHSIYDMVYLVLTRRQAATLATCDIKLQDCCQQRKVDSIVEVDLPE